MAFVIVSLQEKLQNSNNVLMFLLEIMFNVHMAGMLE